MHQSVNKSFIWGRYSRLVAFAVMFNVVFVWTAWALTPKQQFYRADNAYAALKKNPRHQKYRDRWLACIEKYQKVYRLDPTGPWAAAGLYQSGVLYLELHKRSYLPADRQEAADAFKRVIQRFPKSRYTPKSRARLSELGKTATPIPKDRCHRASQKGPRRLRPVDGQCQSTEISGSMGKMHRSVSKGLPFRHPRPLMRPSRCT
jgi:N-acetylmuramoyl-L-alanine amidase